MTIQLPIDAERSIRDAVQSGRFASVDEAMMKAVSLLLQDLKETTRSATVGEALPDPLLGSMRDSADELDEIVADAMKKRQEDTWRAISVE
jgi:Arc/MetJ-type ribon-helix-helix transcriptional regulator